MRTASRAWHLLVAGMAGVVVLGWAVPAGAQAQGQEPRIALLIGNSAYKESPLRNPVNDVRAMAARFRELGFTVLAYENATKKTMESAIIDLGRRLANGGAHGLATAGGAP